MEIFVRVDFIIAGEGISHITTASSNVLSNISYNLFFVGVPFYPASGVKWNGLFLFEKWPIDQNQNYFPENKVYGLGHK